LLRLRVLLEEGGDTPVGLSRQVQVFLRVGGAYRSRMTGPSLCSSFQPLRQDFTQQADIYVATRDDGHDLLALEVNLVE
jgi:hypothetical protein